MNITTLNVTFVHYTREISGLSLQLAVCVEYFLVFLGTMLYSGVIHFEHYGGDPQKRTLINKMVGKQCLTFIIENSIMMTALIFRLFWGPLGHYIGLFVTLSLSWCPMFRTLAMIEILFFKTVQILSFRWSNMLDEGFLNSFLSMFNCTLAIALLYCEYYLASSYPPKYHILSGDYTTVPFLPR